MRGKNYVMAESREHVKEENEMAKIRKKTVVLGMVIALCEVILIPFLPPPAQAQGIKGEKEQSGQLPPETTDSWWKTVQEDISTSEYQVTWQEKTSLPDLEKAWQSPNRAHHFRAYFTPDGVKVISREAETPEWVWGMKLERYGYKGNTQPVSRAELRAKGNRMEYQRKNLTEWYINDEMGLEQGFTLFSSPEGTRKKSNDALIAVEIALTGNVKASLKNKGETIAFTTTEGISVINYGKLYAYDAKGRSLPAHFALEDQKLSILVDPEHAVYPVTIDPLATSPDWMAESDQAGANFSISVGTAGDVNGDGYSDVIVGAHLYDNGQNNEGRVYVYHGSPSGLSTTADWTTESNQAGAWFGWSAGTAGDVNGDGYSDVIVGAVNYDNGQPNEGRAFVYYGSSSGLSTTADWTTESDQADAWFGVSVGTAGDVNGDGYSDVIVGARLYDNGQPNEGRAFVYYGSSSGLSTTADWTAESDQADAWFGMSAGTAGDINGDGYSDVIIGAKYYDNDQTDEGRAFVYYGSSSGLSTTADWTVESDQAGAEFGHYVGTAGDVNGDGYGDVVVGAYLYNNGQDREGRAYVYHGSPSGLSTTADWTAESDQAGAEFGLSVGTAGDVNGDGYSDVIVGAVNYDNGQTDEGRAYVYHGSCSGLSANAAWTAESDQAGAWSGWFVGTAGDINGDGYSDVVVGARFYDNGQMDEGRAYVYYGAPDPVPELQAHYALNEMGGTTATDMSGNGNDGTISGALYTTGVTGTGLLFDGIDDSVSVTESCAVDFGMDSFTYALWVYVTASAGTFDMPIYKGGANNADAGYDMELGTGPWIARISDGTQETSLRFGNEGDYLGQWMYLAGVVDRTANVFRVYVNGNEVDTSDITGFGALSSNKDLIIGGGEDGTMYHFKGIIDEVQLYNGALSGPELLDFYNQYLSKLHARYEFNEGSGIDATDSSINGNNGTIHGAAWSSGISGSGLNYDGVDDFVDFTTNLGITAELTVSAWVYPTAAPNGAGRIIATTHSWGGTGASRRGWTLGIAYGSTDQIQFRVFDNAGNFASANLNNFFANHLNQWTHVTGVFNPFAYARLYVNGVMVAQDTSGVPSSVAYQSGINLRLGMRADNPAQGMWQGGIDEVDIYSRALSEQEVLDLFHTIAPVPTPTPAPVPSPTPTAIPSPSLTPTPSPIPTCSCTPSPTPTPTPNPNLMAHYEFTEGSGPDVTDSSGNGNDGAINGAVWSSGISGAGLSFDGVNDSVDFPTNLGITGELTVSAWVYPTAAPNGLGRIIAATYNWSNNAALRRGWSLGLDSGSDDRIRFRVHDSSGSSASVAIDTFFADNLNRWTHVVGVFSPSEHTRLYVNGIMVSLDVTNIPAAIAYAGGVNLRLGMRADTVTRGMWQGGIDDVRIYDQALSDQEVLDLYNQFSLPVPDPDLQAQYEFNEGSGPEATDSTGNGNDGAINGAAWSSGISGAGLSFDGVDDSVDFPTNLGITGELTVSAWVYPTAAPSGTGRIIAATYDWDSNASLRRGWSLGLDYGSADRILFRVHDSLGSSASVAIDDFFADNLNRWTHVVGVFSPSQQVRVYINGAMAAEGTTGIPAAIAYQAGINLRLGARADSNGGRWQGGIDEVRIYNRALSDQEVLDLYNGS
ncbi:MAG: FG-GAP-like repeat-containing protein [Candidatus Brocadiaceae bacterium]|nr:FG-GAP-like repeat-containing protein [Candidatus Brocadiaceae bacterium]